MYSILIEKSHTQLEEENISLLKEHGYNIEENENFLIFKGPLNSCHEAKILFGNGVIAY